MYAKTELRLPFDLLNPPYHGRAEPMVEKMTEVKFRAQSQKDNE